jgi:hypothetical protein
MAPLQNKTVQRGGGLTCSEDWWKPCWRRGKEGESEFSLIPEGESEREEGFGRAWAMHQLENSQTKTRGSGYGS